MEPSSQAKAAFNKGANEMRYLPNKAAPDALIQRVFSPCNAYQYPGYSVSVMGSQSNPDIIYANGKVHCVFQDAISGGLQHFLHRL